MEFLACIFLFLTFNITYQFFQHSKTHYEGGQIYALYYAYQDIIEFLNLFLFFTSYHIKLSPTYYMKHKIKYDLGLLFMLLGIYSFSYYLSSYLAPTSFLLSVLVWIHYRYALYKMKNKVI